MQFVYPYFLFAISALAIPIIIHLFYFRRFKKVYFTNVRFLREVKEETSARSRLRNLLVLLMRCLAVLFLVFAFAQPFIPKGGTVKKGEKAVSIFVDNSFSMSALSKDLPLIEKAKLRALEIVNAYAPDDQFQILTNDFEGRHQRMVSKDDAIALIEEIKPSPAVKELSKVLSRQQQALNTGNTPNKMAFILSDFQKNISDIGQFKDTSLDVNLIPLQAVQENNVSIDSAWFDAPVQMVNQTNPLIVKMTNHGKEEMENVRLSLSYDGQEKPVGTLHIPARSAVTDTVNITILHTGWHEAKLKISDYPVQFDDTYFFTFNVAQQINVLVINESNVNRFLDAALNGLAGFKATNLSSKNLDYSRFPDYQMIILNGLNNITSGLASELTQYANNGGNVLVFPSPTADIVSYRAFIASFQGAEMGAFEQIEKQVSGINTDEFVFNDVFLNKNANLKLPSTKGNFHLSNAGSRGGEYLLTYRDGSAFVSKNKAGKGNVYLCASPLDDPYSTLSRSGEVFIPMLYKMAISSAKSWQIAYTISKNDFIEAENKVRGTETVYKLHGRQEEFIPEQRVTGPQVILSVGESIRESGFYRLFLTPQDTLAIYGFNYDRKESDLQYLSSSELSSLTNNHIKLLDAAAEANFTAIVGEQNQGIVLWRWCLLLALLFLAAETLLLRFWKA